MVTVELARRLRDAGVRWTPSAGDRFVVPDRDMDDEVFVVADMVVQAHEQPGGHVLRFNGTTEWALDSMEQGDVLWLPHEGQLRGLLAGAFLRLDRSPDGHSVVVATPRGEVAVSDPDAERAYALALLTLLDA